MLKGPVSMKIHAKMGGVTHTVPMPNILTKDTLMIGADVSVILHTLIPYMPERSGDPPTSQGRTDPALDRCLRGHHQWRADPDDAGHPTPRRPKVSLFLPLRVLFLIDPGQRDHH